MAHAGANSIVTVVRAPTLLDESAANALSAVSDMSGYDRIKFQIQVGAMVNGSTLDVWAVESDESNLGNSTNITGAALTQIANTANNTVHVIDVFRPSKRYVGIYANAGTANVTLLAATAERFRGTGTTPITPASSHQYVAVRGS